MNQEIETSKVSGKIIAIQSEQVWKFVFFHLVNSFGYLPLQSDKDDMMGE